MVKFQNLSADDGDEDRFLKIELRVSWRRVIMGWDRMESGKPEGFPEDYVFFQVGFRFSKKALRPSMASLVFINLSR